jgi:predicted patatin/cPLA2 family phospholipase
MKLGLILEGGASRTCFSNGVMDVLMDENIRVDYIIGASAGIANGVSYASWQRGRAHEISRDYMVDPRYMGARYLFQKDNKSYYNIKFAFDEVPNHYVPYDYEALKNYTGEVVACVTRLKTGRAEYLRVTAEDPKWKVLQASCALPILFQPVKIDGKYYMDGGIADSIPLEQAIRSGCDKNIVVLTRERSYVKEEGRTTKLAANIYRKYPQFAEAILTRAERYNANRRKVFELEKEGKAFIIEPRNVGGFKRTESSPDKLEALYQQGVDCAEARMEQLREYLERPAEGEA